MWLAKFRVATAGRTKNKPWYPNGRFKSLRKEPSSVNGNSSPFVPSCDHIAGFFLIVLLYCMKRKLREMFEQTYYLHRLLEKWLLVFPFSKGIMLLWVSEFDFGSESAFTIWQGHNVFTTILPWHQSLVHIYVIPFSSQWTTKHYLQYIPVACCYFVTDLCCPIVHIQNGLCHPCLKMV